MKENYLRKYLSFPYDMKEMFSNNDAGILRTTPYGNNLIADFAKESYRKRENGS